MTREINFNHDQGSSRACIIFIDGIVKAENIQDFIIRPLLENTNKSKFKHTFMEYIFNNIISSTNAEMTDKIHDITKALVEGKSVLLIEGYNLGILIETVQWEARSLEEPLRERSPKGPAIGLTEKLKTNINLIRGTIKTPDLCVQNMEVGTASKTAISIIYMESIVDKGILIEVQNRLNSINLKYVENSRVIEEKLEGKPITFFPLISTKERLDSVVSHLYEGRVVIIVDGIPHGIITPTLFVDFIQAPSDYHLKLGRLINRLLRFLAFILASFLPAIYVSLANFKKDDLPEKLSKALITKDELLPTFWEMFVLILLTTMLLDATYRVPKSSVLLLSLISTIVIGETAVTAKLVHPVSLIVIGITFLTSLIIKELGPAAHTMAISFLIIAKYFGFNGMIISTTLLIIYMVTLKSVGVPYLAPLIPFRYKELKDVLYRGNLQKLINSKHAYPENKD